MHVPRVMHSAAGNMKSDVHRCTSPWSVPVLVDIQRCVRNTCVCEGTVRNWFLLVCLLNNKCSVVIMFDDIKRTSRTGILMLPSYNKTIAARCDWGPWVLYTLGCTKPHGPVTACNNCIMYPSPGITQRPWRSWSMLPLVLALVPLQKFPIHYISVLGKFKMVLPSQRWNSRPSYPSFAINHIISFLSYQSFNMFKRRMRGGWEHVLNVSVCLPSNLQLICVNGSDFP